MKSIKIITASIIMIAPTIIISDTIIKNNVTFKYGINHSEEIKESSGYELSGDILLTKRLYSSVLFSNTGTTNNNGNTLEEQNYGFGLGYEVKVINNENYNVSIFIESNFGFSNLTNKTTNQKHSKANTGLGFGMRNTNNGFTNETKYEYKVNELNTKDNAHILSANLLKDINISEALSDFSIGGSIKTDLSNNENNISAMLKYYF